ncbi:hypothetical protein BKA83DRAFT_4282601, partial [Pisolithus microcarpus]
MAHPSLLDAIHDVLAISSPPASEAHLFSSRSSSISSRLRSILDTTSQVNDALTQLSAMPLSNQTSKLVSLMKQHAAISASIAISRAAVTGISSADRIRVAEWGPRCGLGSIYLSFLEVRLCPPITLAGKVLVLDIDIDGRVLVKTSFAVGNNVPNGTAVAPDLDAFLAREVSKWVEAAKYASSGESSPSMGEPAVVAADCARTFGERGIRWFMEPVVAHQHFISRLDKLLVQRAFPILYLNFPSLSFLVWLSPHAYLHLHSSMPKHVRGATGQADISLVPSSEVLTCWRSCQEGQNDHAFPSSPSHSWILEFSRSPLIYNGHTGTIQSFLGVDVATDILMGIGTPAGASVGSGLGGMGPFGSMSQFHFNNFSSSQTTSVENPDSISSSSWVDLLLNPTSSGEHYKTTYHSPSGAYPPLNLRLSVPQEPGFLLQRVPVRTTSQVSRVLEVRFTRNSPPSYNPRAEAPLSRYYCSCLSGNLEDTTAPPQDPTNIDPPSYSSATELLASLLEGSLTPKSIPVSVFLPSTSLPPLAQSHRHATSCTVPQFSFQWPGSSCQSQVTRVVAYSGTGDMDMDMEIPGLSMSMNSSMEIGIGTGMGMEMGGMGSMGMDFGGSVSPPRQPPMIILSSPAKAPATGLVELRVSFVPGSSNGAGTGGGDCGVKVEASPGIDTKGMDEIVRRGGIWGLPGRVWDEESQM